MAMVIVGGGIVDRRSASVGGISPDLVLPPDPEDYVFPDDYISEPVEPEPLSAIPPEPSPQPEQIAPARPHASRAIAPSVVAPPASGLDDVLEREAPRAPLGELGLALPPKPKPLKAPVLYRPVAVESALVEAMGRRVAIAGAQSVAPEETCTVDGVSWPCGARARTAFRLWLRGRALTCDLPDDTEGDPIVAPCRLGKQDVAAWLVANGWARAAPGGPYGEAQKAAERDGKGIFGRPPDLSSLPPELPSVLATPPTDPPAPGQ